MKTNLTKFKFIILGVLFLMLFTVKGYSQPNAYNCCIKNITQTSPTTLEFDIFLEWTGTNTQKLTFFQAGINFNYTGMANGGAMTGAFKPGSASTGLAPIQQAPNWNLNGTSKQIRMAAAISTPSAFAIPVPGPPGVKMGTYVITNTQPFTSLSTPNFVWSFVTGSSTLTQTVVSCYLNGATTGTNITAGNTAANHCVEGNPQLNPPCPTANAGGPYVTCGDVKLNGSITFATTGTWSSSGTGTFDPNNTNLNAIYHPSAADLGSGVVLTLTTDAGAPGCTAASSSVTVNFTSIDDGDACTVDGCDQSVGLPTHTPLNFDDGNACTNDACNSSTGPVYTPVDPNDNNPCTDDFCNTSTGVFHTPTNIDDGNACTTDACDSNTGISHTPINPTDGNACTDDACNTLTGAFTNTPINTSDGNACTDDACNTITGAITNTPVNTDDGNACTTDACNTLTGAITNTPVNTDDGNACTDDACNTLTGAITNTAVNTDDGDACTVDACNSTTGAITHTSNTDDGNACTTDACDSITGIVTNTPVNTDDGDACTTDACNTLTGAITNTPVNTDDGNACTNDACNTLTGDVTHTAVNTDDGNACTTDACNTLTGAITNTPVNTDDGNACTDDACNTLTGDVTHTAVNTDDGNACTTDACNTLTGAITNTPVNTDDGNACTDDACNTLTGAITNTAVNTDDGDACTVDACNTLNGDITHTNNTDDGNACTTDACDTNTGVVTNDPVNTDDGNACTTDGCNTSTGVFNNPVNTDDGNACTIDACDTFTGAITHTDDTPVVTATAGTIACYGGTTCVTVTATGGLTPYSDAGVFCGYSIGDYTFEVTDAKGCVATSSNVSITEPTKLDLSPASTPSSGADGTASANASGGTPPYTYAWSNGQVTDPATGLAPGSYSVVVTDANGCTEAATVVIATSCNLDAPGPISGPAAACKKQSGIVYCATPNPFATSYMWLLPAGVTIVGPANGSCITVKFTSKWKGGFICVKAVTPCGTTASVCKNVIDLKKKPATPGSITGPTSACPNTSATYSIAPVATATSYEWKVDGNQTIVSGQGTTSIVVQRASNWKSGKVKVKAVNCKGKSGDRSLNVSKPSGCRLSVGAETTVIPTEALSSLIAYPNPTSGKTQITFTSDRDAKYTLKVVDMIGKVLISQPLPVVEGFNQKNIDLEGMSKGIYLISVQTEEGSTQTLRLIVE